jgi:hypothetical protein
MRPQQAAKLAADRTAKGEEESRAKKKPRQAGLFEQ